MRILPILFLMLFRLAYGQELNNPNNLKPCPQNVYDFFDNCWATMVDGSGNGYIGEFQNNKRHGLGSYTDSKGTYVGEFREGVYHGAGEFLENNGRKFTGTFENGNFIGIESELQKEAYKRRKDDLARILAMTGEVDEPEISKCVLPGVISTTKSAEKYLSKFISSNIKFPKDKRTYTRFNLNLDKTTGALIFDRDRELASALNRAKKVKSGNEVDIPFITLTCSHN
jgi:hypothetical protein